MHKEYKISTVIPIYNIEKYLEKTIKANQTDVQAVKLLTKLLCKHNKYVQAEKLLKQAMQAMPMEADILYLLAKIYHTLKSDINYLKYLKLTEKKAVSFTGNIELLREEIQEAENK